MRSATHRFSPFRMSTDCNQLQTSPKKEQEQIIKVGISSPDNKIQSPNHEIRSESHENRGDSDRREEDSTKIDNGEENCEAKVSSRESENCVPEEEEDDEGFRTPTSSDHKIPAIIRCPSPPRKSRPQYSRLKRRAPPESCCCRRLRFLAAAEVESVLWPMIGDNVEEEKSKKARRTAGDKI